MKYIKYLVACLFLTYQVSAEETNRETKSYTLKQFTQPISNLDQINSGLSLLNINQNPASISQANQFQSDVYEILNAALQNTNGLMQYTVSEKIMTVFTSIRSVRELTIRFKSLVQRAGDDSSNTVVARLYIPVKHQKYCSYKFATSIFLHHILNEVDVIEKASQFMSAGILNDAAAFAVIHMPYYGERSDRSSAQKQFLTSDLNEFKKNVAQLILDTHMLKNIIESMPELDSGRINLSGISLGGVLGITVGAFDQSYNSYTFVVGGGNVADILLNRANSRPDSEVATALKDLTESTESVRLHLSAMDGYTWLHKYQNKKITFVSALRDDIIDFEKSVRPLVTQLSQNNKVTHQINDDTHSPSGNMLSKYNNVFKPIVSTVLDRGQTFKEACQLTPN